MKKTVWSLCLLCGLSAAVQAQSEAVGINTENPQGVLHIDGASSPGTVNSPQGPVSGEQAVDDVVIDEAGRMGIGVAVPPAARVDILSGAPGGALRIQDGTQGEGKALVSDAYGAASWTLMPYNSILWYAALYLEGNHSYNSVYDVRPVRAYTGSFISSATGGSSVSAASGTITVPFKGKYRIQLVCGYHLNRGETNYKGTAVLRVGAEDRRSITTWGISPSNGASHLVVGLFNLEANDVLSLHLDQRETYSANAVLIPIFMVELLQLTE